jgi:hypothetical protein
MPPVSVNAVSETATSPIPVHWRRPSSKPKKRSASTARNTRPPASTAWPTEIGARVSAATCSANATAATPQPILYHLERNRSTALRAGWRMSMSGAATAPRCLNRKARFVPSADSSAQIRPTPTASETLLTVDRARASDGYAQRWWVESSPGERAIKLARTSSRWRSWRLRRPFEATSPGVAAGRCSSGFRGGMAVREDGSGLSVVPAPPGRLCVGLLDDLEPAVEPGERKEPRSGRAPGEDHEPAADAPGARIGHQRDARGRGTR